MKKIVLGLLAFVLFVPALALAQEAQEPPVPQPYGGPQVAGARANIEKLQGQIVLASKTELTINSGTKDKPEQIKIRIPERRAELADLLSKGVGKKAELLCRKTPQGDWVLLRIGSIEGVDVSSQPALGPAIREGLHRRAEQLSPEQRERLRDRFTAMSEYFKENPQQREELKKLAKEDPEAFRERIRQIHEQSIQGSQPGQSWPGPMPSGQRMGMGPLGQGGPHFSPEMMEIHKFEQQTHQLAKQYCQAEGKEKDELAGKLRTTLSEIFDKKAQAQSQEVKQLEKRLEELRDRIKTRQKNRETIIQKRFEQLTSSEHDDLAW